jgi:hypothetical protein
LAFNKPAKQEVINAGGPDGRATTIPVHGNREIGPPLFYRILQQLGVDQETFDRLR